MKRKVSQSCSKRTKEHKIKKSKALKCEDKAFDQVEPKPDIELEEKILLVKKNSKTTYISLSTATSRKINVKEIFSKSLLSPHIYTALSYKLKKIIKENHSLNIFSIKFNENESKGGQDRSNILFSISPVQVNVYDNENFGDHLDLISHYILPCTYGQICCFDYLNTEDDCWIFIGTTLGFIIRLSLALSRVLLVERPFGEKVIKKIIINQEYILPSTLIVATSECTFSCSLNLGCHSSTYCQLPLNILHNVDNSQDNAILKTGFEPLFKCDIKNSTLPTVEILWNKKNESNTYEIIHIVAHKKLQNRIIADCVLSKDYSYLLVSTLDGFLYRFDACM